MRALTQIPFDSLQERFSSHCETSTQGGVGVHLALSVAFNISINPPHSFVLFSERFFATGTSGRALLTQQPRSLAAMAFRPSLMAVWSKPPARVSFGAPLLRAAPAAPLSACSEHHSSSLQLRSSTLASPLASRLLPVTRRPVLVLPQALPWRQLRWYSSAMSAPSAGAASSSVPTTEQQGNVVPPSSSSPMDSSDSDPRATHLHADAVTDPIALASDSASSVSSGLNAAEPQLSVIDSIMRRLTLDPPLKWGNFSADVMKCVFLDVFLNSFGATRNWEC
jgi:hypothetical protein